MPDYSGVSRRTDAWPYAQIVTVIEAAIRSGEMAPGEMLPSENEIARQPRTSRFAVRYALDVLRDRGLVYTRPRLGTFVSPENRWAPAREL
jgi:DNA-binding GntR family transcriptional regulator